MTAAGVTTEAAAVRRRPAEGRALAAHPLVRRAVVWARDRLRKDLPDG